MKQWYKRILAVIAGVALMAALMIPASGSSTVYFMAVNDNFMETTTANMPLTIGRILYVPYTMLYPPLAQGVDLGVRAQYSPTRSTVVVTDGQSPIVFDLQSNTAKDAAGASVDARAIVRNSMVYLPIIWLCKYYPSISYSVSTTRYGSLVRLTNSSAILDDNEFIDATDTMMRNNLQRYQASLATPTPSPAQTPAPTHTPAVTPAPTLPVPLVYLGFRYGPAAERVADALESFGSRALFLFTADELAEADDFVRRLAARGHTIGFQLDGEDAQTCMDQFSAAKQLLEEIARCTSVIVSANQLSRQDQEQLADAGCALWSPTMQGMVSTSDSLLNRLHAANANLIELACEENIYPEITALLRRLSGDDFRLRQVIPPIL